MTSSVRQFGFTTLATHAFAGRIELKSRSSLDCISETQRSTLSAFTRVFAHYGDALQIPIFASRPAIAGRGDRTKCGGRGAVHQILFDDREATSQSPPPPRKCAVSLPRFHGGMGPPKSRLHFSNRALAEGRSRRVPLASCVGPQFQLNPNVYTADGLRHKFAPTFWHSLFWRSLLTLAC
jgi:hypothetical protein